MPQRPSLTFTKCAENLPPTSNVFVVGMQQPDDVVDLIYQGHRVSIIDKCTDAFSAAGFYLEEKKLDSEILIIKGDFVKTILAENAFDALISDGYLSDQTMLDELDSFVKKASAILKSGAHLYFRATGKNVDETLLRKTFGKDFHIREFSYEPDGSQDMQHQSVSLIAQKPVI